MKKNFFFLSSYPHSAPGNRLNVFCQFRMLQSVGSPPPLGEGARDGCGRQPLRSGRAGGFAVGPALALALWRRLLFMEDGRNADGFSRHRTNNAGRFTALP